MDVNDRYMRTAYMVVCSRELLGRGVHEFETWNSLSDDLAGTVTATSPHIM